MPAAYSLTFLRIKPMGGVFATPPPHPQAELFVEEVASEQRQGGVFTTPLEELFVEKVASERRQGGVFTTPPQAERHGDARPRRSIDLDLDKDLDRGKTIIDRVLAAKPKDFDARELSEAKRWVHGYQCNDKYGGSRDRNRNPPDDTVLAQILTACGSLAGVINLIQALGGARTEPGDQYGWYVTMALNRIHGIAPVKVKAGWARLKLARRPSPPAITGEQQPLPGALADKGSAQTQDQQFARDLMADVQQKRKGAG